LSNYINVFISTVKPVCVGYSWFYQKQVNFEGLWKPRGIKKIDMCNCHLCRHGKMYW